ncbi:MAG: aminotransferase class IV [Prosthecobacter sp.]|uniref:aminotransferase class IV n=1 Tax=Prosthecobacter sp. TaxID=1965333 RepID=UPI0026355465|nr:aminotransferase class IV [Prosthecobacter sp.]MCF7789364.1 aminotransferase class IV [Prosthecobacter sp.]
MKLPSHTWINGRIVSTAEARISPFDHGFLVGDGVFETLVARHGRPFTPTRHWRRLVASCSAMNITAPEYDVYLQAMLETMQANGLADARIRVTLTSGDGPLGSDRGEAPATMTVAVTPLKPWPPTETVMVVPWTRNERSALAGIKSTSYGDNVRALALAHEQGAGEAIFANTRDELCEGTGTNIFIVTAGVVKTPPLSSGCLAGVTRALVLEACAVAGIAVEETALPIAVLQSCDEAFLTSSTRDVHPLARIDQRDMPGVAGAVTMRVAQAFQDFVAGRDDP